MAARICAASVNHTEGPANLDAPIPTNGSSPWPQRNPKKQYNIRASSWQCDLIDQAAEGLGRDQSDSMLEAACCEAEDVLLDQTLFTVDPGAFAKLHALSDRPSPPTDHLRRLLQTKRLGQVVR